MIEMVVFTYVVFAFLFRHCDAQTTTTTTVSTLGNVAFDQNTTSLNYSATTTTTTTTSTEATTTTASLPSKTPSTAPPTPKIVTTAKPPPPTRSKVKLKFVQKQNQGNIDQNAYVGSVFKFDCRVETPDGSELIPPKMQWYKDDVPLQEISYRVFPHEGLEHVYSLELRNLVKADAGKYKCTADNGYNKAITHTVTLKIRENAYDEKPTMLSFNPINPTVVVGEKVQFHCKTNKIKDQTPMIQWIRYSQRPYIPPTTPKNITANLTTPLPTTMPPDIPVNGTNVTTATPTTTTAPPTTTTPLVPDETLSKNFLAVDKMSNLSYVINDTIFEKMTLKLEQEDESFLTIHNVGFQDMATYICVIFNENGYTKNSSFLTVKPVPPKTIDELEDEYYSKYSKRSLPKYPLTVLIGLPVFLFILLVIGCVWWRENEARRAEKYEKLQKKIPAVEIIPPIQEEKKPLMIPDICVVGGTTDEDDISKHSNQRPYESNASLEHIPPSNTPAVDAIHFNDSEPGPSKVGN